MDYLVIECPHCHDSIIIYKNEINCRIFRHAVFKSNGEPINPHTSKEECEKLVETGSVHGCGKPFQLNEKDEPEICEYI